MMMILRIPVGEAKKPQLKHVHTRQTPKTWQPPSLEDDAREQYNGKSLVVDLQGLVIVLFDDMMSIKRS